MVDVNRIGAQHRDRAVAAAVANRSAGVSKVVAKVAAQCALLGPSWSGRAENTLNAVRVACVHPSGATWLLALSRSNFTRGRLDLFEVSYRIGSVQVNTTQASRMATLNGSATVAGIPVPVFDGAEANADKMYRILRLAGVSRAGAAALMANIEMESGYNPGAVESGGPITVNKREGVGLAQWSFSRRHILQTKAQESGLPWWCFEFQLQFMLSELHLPYYKTSWVALMSATDPVAAAVIVHRNFEGSNASDASIRATRGVLAAKIFAQHP